MNPLKKCCPLHRLVRAVTVGLAVAAMAMPLMKDADAAEARPAPAAFQVHVTGQGEPVILIPGLASPGAVWDGAVSRFCGSRQCHVLTLAGFAGVPAIDAPLLPTVEQQLSDYIAARGLARPTVIGHSMGGWLALKLGADHPQQVGRIIVVDALPALGATHIPSITAQQLETMAAQMRDSLLHSDDALYTSRQRSNAATMITGEEGAQRLAGWVDRSDRKTVATSMYQMLKHDLRPELARIQAPTLVLGAGAAFRGLLPRAAVEAMFQAQYSTLRGVQFELDDNARHFIMYDDPEWLYARIGKFLN